MFSHFIHLVCDFNIGGTAKEVNSTLCNFPCGGDSTFECGGASLITIYQNTTGVLPKNKATVAGNWTFSACHTWAQTTPHRTALYNKWDSDAVNGAGRSLLERLPIPTVTIETCTAACSSAGFNISGLEFGQECCTSYVKAQIIFLINNLYFIGCGSSFLVANTTAATTDCSQACDADHTELCGAASRLSVYLKWTGNGIYRTVFGQSYEALNGLYLE